MSASTVPLQFVLKVAARCNLNCSYCYVYNKGDDSWRRRPPFMSQRTFESALSRVVRHCKASRQPSVQVIFHGGEPTLIGVDIFERWCRQLHTELDPITRLQVAIQTNGTRIDADWCRVWTEQGVDVGVSIDGPESVHNRFRVDHGGHGSYAQVLEGIDQMHDASIPIQLLSVVQPGTDGAALHDHLCSLRPMAISYLLPDHTHESVQMVRTRWGKTPCADVLLPAFAAWLQSGFGEVHVPLFLSVLQLIMGGESELDLLGNHALRFLFVETDGEIEALDVLRVCGHGFAATGLNIERHDFHEVAQNPLQRVAVFDGPPLPPDCRPCPESTTCAGGYLPHRFSRENGL